jgi:hypothetical protein
MATERLSRLLLLAIGLVVGPAGCASGAAGGQSDEDDGERKVYKIVDDDRVLSARDQDDE